MLAAHGRSLRCADTAIRVFGTVSLLGNEIPPRVHEPVGERRLRHTVLEGFGQRRHLGDIRYPPAAQPARSNPTSDSGEYAKPD